MKVILCISDLQIPFEHHDALAFVKHVLKTFSKPSDDITIVNMGDEVDQHTASIKHTPDPNGKSAGDELKEAIHRLRDWYRAFPKMLICSSNHTYRAYKKAFHAGLPSEFLRSLNDIYQAPPGWRWADRWIIDDILFEHGENVSGPLAAITAAQHNRQSTVIGHQHSNGGVLYSGSVNGNIFGLNTGCLIDVDAYAFSYGSKLRRKPTLGCGIIIDGVPYFVPMRLNSKKRWIGKI